MNRRAALRRLMICLLTGAALASGGCGKKTSATATQKAQHRPNATVTKTGVDPKSANTKTGDNAGAQRISGKSQRPTTTPSATAGPDCLALQHSGPVDVLLMADGPAYDATAIDSSLDAVVTKLRKLTGVAQVWSHAQAGAMRMVVRFESAQSAVAAQASVHAVWNAARPPQLSPPRLAVIAPGQRAMAAITVIANAGRQAATVALQTQINPEIVKLPVVGAVWIAGAVRPYEVVQWMPPYMAQHKIGIGAAHRALIAALQNGTGELSALLKKTTLVSRPKKKGPISLADIGTTVSGVGEPIPIAYTGKRRVVATIVEAGQSTAGIGLGAQFTNEIVHKRLRNLDKTFERFHHAIGSMQRFRLVRKPNVEPSNERTFLAQLTALGKSPLYHDVFTLSGLDGIPNHMQSRSVDGQLWTLWVAAGAGLRQEEVYENLATIFGGWRVVPMPSAHDTAMGWLTQSRMTATAFFASNDGVLLGATVKTLTQEFAKERRIGMRKTGPHRGRTGEAYGTTKQSVAQEKRVHAMDLSLANRMRTRLIFVGRLNGKPIWTGLPTGVMATRQSELPLGSATGLVAWRQVLRVHNQSQDTPRLRLNGMATLWYGADPLEDAAEEFGKAFWMAVEQRIEPSRRLEVRSMLLGQRALSRARSAR